MLLVLDDVAFVEGQQVLEALLEPLGVGLVDGLSGSLTHCHFDEGDDFGTELVFAFFVGGFGTVEHEVVVFAEFVDLGCFAVPVVADKLAIRDFDRLGFSGFK